MERETHMDSKRERVRCWTENRQGMTWMLQLQEWPLLKSNNVNKLC